MVLLFALSALPFKCLSLVYFISKSFSKDYAELLWGNQLKGLMAALGSEMPLVNYNNTELTADLICSHLELSSPDIAHSRQ